MGLNVVILTKGHRANKGSVTTGLIFTNAFFFLYSGNISIPGKLAVKYIEITAYSSKVQCRKCLKSQYLVQPI